jgi:membrane protein DedA with SNARE-associated domain
MLFLAAHLASSLPGWLQEPSWLRPFTHAIRVFILHHQFGGLYLVIFLEELGVPLPAPGDAAIAYGGYLTTTGAIPYPLAYRRYGRPFIRRYGRYIGLTEHKLNRAERAFVRWGPWTIIIGRHIPGMRIVISALSGILNVPYRVFIPCVLFSATIWAAIFLEVGRRIGPRVRDLFGIFPAYLLPWLGLGLVVLAIGYLAYEHGFLPKARNRGAVEPR